MKTLYMLFPFVRTDRLPRYNSIEQIVHDNFYLFVAYCDNLCILKDYIAFINENFDNAFHKLNYPIIPFKYPDNLAYSSGISIQWINEHYQLDNCPIRDDYVLNYDELMLYTKNRKTTIYATDTLLMETSALGTNLFDSDILIGRIYYLSSYLKDTQAVVLLRKILLAICRYQQYATACKYGVMEGYDPTVISEQLLSFYQLQSYVNQEYLKRQYERSETNGSIFD